MCSKLISEIYWRTIGPDQIRKITRRILASGFKIADESLRTYVKLLQDPSDRVIRLIVFREIETRSSRDLQWLRKVFARSLMLRYVFLTGFPFCLHGMKFFVVA